MWIFTVCKGRIYPGSAGQGLITSASAKTIFQPKVLYYLITFNVLKPETLYPTPHPTTLPPPTVPPLPPSTHTHTHTTHTHTKYLANSVDPEWNFRSSLITVCKTLVNSFLLEKIPFQKGLGVQKGITDVVSLVIPRKAASHLLGQKSQEVVIK